jgi:hypothetical protein
VDSDSQELFYDWVRANQPGTKVEVDASGVEVLVQLCMCCGPDMRVLHPEWVKEGDKLLHP